MIYAQIAGLFAVIAWLISIRKKKKKTIIKYQIVANAFYALQYLFLKAFTAVGMSSFAIIRTSVFYNYEIKKREIPKAIFILFEIITLVIGVLTYTNIMSIIPTINSMFYLYSLNQKKLSNLYIFILFAAILWLLYNINVGAYVAIIGNIFEIVFASMSIKETSRRK